jgi:hypothetical protein
MLILKLLNADDFYCCGANIDIAKGKYKLAETLKEGVKQVKRKLYEKRGN